MHIVLTQTGFLNCRSDFCEKLHEFNDFSKHRSSILAVLDICWEQGWRDAGWEKVRYCFEELEKIFERSLARKFDLEN
jgi:hypothetical protein